MRVAFSQKSSPIACPATERRSPPPGAFPDRTDETQKGREHRDLQRQCFQTRGPPRRCCETQWREQVAGERQQDPRRPAEQRPEHGQHQAGRHQLHGQQADRGRDEGQAGVAPDQPVDEVRADLQVPVVVADQELLGQTDPAHQSHVQEVVGPVVRRQDDPGTHDRLEQDQRRPRQQHGLPPPTGPCLVLAVSLAHRLLHPRHPAIRARRTRTTSVSSSPSPKAAAASAQVPGRRRPARRTSPRAPRCATRATTPRAARTGGPAARGRRPSRRPAGHRPAPAPAAHHAAVPTPQDAGRRGQARRTAPRSAGAGGRRPVARATQRHGQREPRQQRSAVPRVGRELDHDVPALPAGMR